MPAARAAGKISLANADESKKRRAQNTPGTQRRPHSAKYSGAKDEAGASKENTTVPDASDFRNRATRNEFNATKYANIPTKSADRATIPRNSETRRTARYRCGIPVRLLMRSGRAAVESRRKTGGSFHTPDRPPLPLAQDATPYHADRPRGKRIAACRGRFGRRFSRAIRPFGRLGKARRGISARFRIRPRPSIAAMERGKSAGGRFQPEGRAPADLLQAAFAP